MAQFRRRTQKSQLKYRLTYFYKKKSKSSSRSGQKRSNFEIFKFWKKLHVSDAEWAQESNGDISFYVGQI